MRWALVAALAVLATANEHIEARQKFVDELNAMPGMTWKAGINPRFHGAPIGVAKDLCGVLPNQKEKLEKKIATGEITRGPQQATVAIPTSFDSGKNWPMCADIINDIRDQSNCGCCWAFGGAEAASDRMCIATKGQIKVPLSAEDTCFCASFNGCGGGEIDTPWSHMKREGIVTGGQYNNTGAPGGGWCSSFQLPHCHHHGPQRNDPYPPEGAPGCPSQNSRACPRKCDSDAKAPHNVFAQDKYTFTGTVMSYGGNADAIAQAIMEHGPLEVAFTVYSDFENYVSGIYQHKSGSVLGGHAVKMVGWGEENGVKYWKIANSWNPYWGENGYFRIIRGVDSCGIESQVSGSSPDATFHKKQ